MKGRYICYTMLIVGMAVWRGAAGAHAEEAPTNQAPSSAVSPKVVDEKPGAPAPAKPLANEPPARIAPGDILFIEVKEDHAQLTNNYRTNAKGMVEFGYVGEIAVEGLTPAELADKLKRRLEAEYLQKATVYVEVRNQPQPKLGEVASRGLVYVMGKVRNPGPIEIPANEKNFTVSKAIIRAGIADFAKLSKTKLVRLKPDGKSEEIIVNVYDIIYRGKLELDVPVQKDDWIIVPEALFQGPS